MYHRHFNLKKKPFELSSDHSFLWLSKKHAHVLDLLRKGIGNNVGLMVLTGDVGTGKTTLIHEIMHSLDAAIHPVKISDPCFEMHELFSLISKSFGFDSLVEKDQKFSCFMQLFLRKLDEDGTKALLIIDEAHRVSQRFFKELLAWSQFESANALIILLSGQLELKKVLKDNIGAAWSKKIDVLASLCPLDETETRQYIIKRLELAGTRQEIFLQSALHEAFVSSQGIPRKINILCDQALMTAFSEGKYVIDASGFRPVVEQLKLPVTAEKKKKLVENSNPSRTPASSSIVKSAIFLLSAACVLLLAAGLINMAHLKLSSVPDKVSEETTNPDMKSPARLKLVFGKIVQKKIEGKNSDQAYEISINHSQQSSQEKIGLGYSPVPVEIYKQPSPVLIYEQIHDTEKIVEPMDTQIKEKTRGKNSVTLIQEDQPTDIDQFVNEVFLLKKQPVFHSSKILDNESVQPVKNMAKKSLPSKENPTDRNNSQKSDGQPDPDAIIEWLIKKKKLK